MAESSKDSGFSWDSVISEETKQDSPNHDFIPPKCSVRKRSSQAHPKSTVDASRRKHDSARETRRILTRSSSDHIEPKKPGKQAPQGSTHASVSDSAAMDSNERAQPKSANEAAKTVKKSARQPPRIRTHSSSQHAEEKKTRMQDPPGPSHAHFSKSAAAKNDNRGTTSPREEETCTGASTQAAKSRRLTIGKAVEGSQSPLLTRSDNPGQSNRDLTSRETSNRPSTECGVAGCEMGATSGLHKCKKCGADVHPYCCNRILGQPPQQDNSDPIYCIKCWTGSGVSQPLVKEKT